MKKLLIASWNPWKIEMFKSLLKWVDIDLIFLSDLKLDIESPEENWHTVEENAFIKAKYYSEATWLPTIWDDAWFEVKALWWLPWVKARRWNGELPDSISDEDWLDFFFKKIEHIDDEQIEWAFPFCRCLYLPDWRHFYQSEKIDFYISREQRRPYIPWFPLSSVCIFTDWRHQLDIPHDDPIFFEHRKRDWLLKLIENI